MERLLQLKLEKFHRPLGSMDGVILVQAGINLASHKLNRSAASHMIDCTDLPRRLRVGPGIFRHAFATSTKEWYCAVAGINVIPCEESTSSAAPLATSYLLYLQEQKLFQTNSRELLEEVKLSDLNRVRDPGSGRQFLRMVGY